MNISDILIALINYLSYFLLSSSLIYMMTKKMYIRMVEQLEHITTMWWLKNLNDNLYEIAKLKMEITNLKMEMEELKNAIRNGKIYTD